MSRPVRPASPDGPEPAAGVRVSHLEALDKGMAHRLTLVLKAPNFDELALIRHWVAISSWPSVVQPVTPELNQPRVFVADLARSLSAITDTGFAVAAICAAATPRSALEDGVTELLNAAAAARDDFAWVLQDYDVIIAAAIHQAVGSMLDYAPPQMHLYLTSDREPLLPNLSRLRARRHLLTLHLRTGLS